MRTSAAAPTRDGTADGGPGDERSEQRPEALVEELPAILYLAEPGIDGRWHYVSRGVEAILGFSPREWVADPGMWARQVHPQDRERIFDREMSLGGAEEPDEYRMLHRDGSTVWVRDEAALITQPDGHALWHGVILDISDRKLAESELERGAEQQAAVARLGKLALDGSDFGELMRRALEEATRVTGAPAAAVLQQDAKLASLTVRAGRGLSWADMAALLVRPGAELPPGTVGRIEGAGGTWGLIWLASPRERPLGDAETDFLQGLANILAAAIQRRATEDAIRFQAVHDHLTGLPNRVLLLERLARSLERAAADVAVVLLDIDNFKLINDGLGHAAGDELLAQIAPRLRTALRPRDLIARLGGDEFVVLIEQVADERAAADCAERIVACFEPPFALGAGEHFAKASLGIALSAGDATSTPASLIRDADAALYQAKARGRARFEIFDRAMRARAVERLSVENDLRRALERDELQLVYQPIVSLRDRSIHSVEALLRWQHPQRGPISPADFVPVAEDSGLIDAIGRWVLGTACTQATRWPGEPGREAAPGISVNVSARQFMQRDIEATVEAVLAATGIDPGRLCLEITESVLLDGSRAVSETIKRAARLGVRFALDDFGTGYSSLSYLSDLPIDGLKIDRSFVQTLGLEPRTTAITTAIVRMAQALSIDVIAEGVETELQLSVLRDLGCELAQGFYLHRPAPAEDVSLLLEAERAVTPAR